MWLPEGNQGNQEALPGRGLALSGVSGAETSVKGLDPCGQVGIIVPHSPGSRRWFWFGSEIVVPAPL